jgi:hypothetical protein
VNASNGSIYMNGTQAWVTGGNNAIFLEGASGNAVEIFGTNGVSDGVYGSNGAVYLNSAQATVAGNSDTISFYGTGNSMTANGASDAFVFQPAIGQDVIGGFNASDSMQFSASDFANFTALSQHMTQSGSNTLITLDANRSWPFRPSGHDQRVENVGADP